MSKCPYCEGKGKIREPNDKAQFWQIVDLEMEKGNFASGYMAQEKAFERVGYTIIPCPHCNGTGQLE